MDDLISRQAAIDSLWELDVEIRPSAINAIIDMMRTLPPEETSKRTGKSAQNVPNNDLISRKAAIEAVDATWWNAIGIRKTIQELPSAQPELIEKTAYIRGFEQGRTQGMIDTKAEEVAQPEPQWIPCSERLPEKEKKTYWVCTDTEYQCECRWTNNRFGLGEGEWGWSIFDTPQYSKPIAWMPLPESYKGEES